MWKRLWRGRLRKGFENPILNALITCGEGACPRWTAKQVPALQPNLIWHPAFAGLRLLGSRTGASPLATGFVQDSGAAILTRWFP